MLKCDHCGRVYKATRAKQRSTEKRHWCSNACVNEETRRGGILHEKVKQVWRKNHGVNHPMMNPEILQRQQATCRERFGVDTPLQLDSVREILKRHDIIEKKYATYKRNGSYFKSGPEDAYYDQLCARYGVDDIERQIRVNKWSIDFYIKSIDTHIQFDGVYWHGLDRPINMIAEHRTKQDVAIHKKWMTDRVQDAWFAERNMKLIRVTDKQVISMNGVESLFDVLSKSVSTSQ